MGKEEAGPHHRAAPPGCLSVAKFLIDECLHTSLAQLAYAAGHTADHVTYIARGGAKDWQLMDTILERDYTFVTNNRVDFLTLYRRTPVHAGLVIVVPNVTPVRQHELFQAALDRIGQRGIVNAVLEVAYHGDRIECREYPMSAK